MTDNSLVNPEERQDARQWLESMLAALTAVEKPNVVEPEIICVRQGWGDLRIGVSMHDKKTPLCLAGRTFASGLGTHADSEVVVRLPVGARRLTGLCGVNDSLETRKTGKSLVFSVEVEGKEVWLSGPQNAADAPAPFDIKLAGSKAFTLKVTGPINYAHADWVDLKVTLVNGAVIAVGQPCGARENTVGFSFQYEGKASAEILPAWRMKKQIWPEKDGVILHRITRTDPKTGLALTCEIKEYTRFPVVEWGLRLKNVAARKTPLLENIRSLDAMPFIGPFPYLNYWTGDYCSPDGYEPFRVSLAHGEEYRFAPVGGRPTNRAWPYYNLESQDNQRGLIVVVGWAGQWASSFRGLESHAVHITAGQELTHFRLLPGEDVRTPLSVLMFYRGDRVRSQNLWRRWMLAHNLPRPGGQLPKPILASYCAAGSLSSEMAGETEQSQKSALAAYVGAGIKLDYWWMDAGWYRCDGQWPKTGTWEVDADRFPRGLRAVSDRAHRNGMKTLVWFEPERVRPDTWLWKERPQWLLTHKKGDNRLLDLGNPAALRWVINHVSRVIREQGIDLYRQDFNFEPLPYWRAHDAPDRQGITEIRHVEGYLAFWKELRRRFPGMLIDSCASGGRRNDLETMRLSVPFHKTDYDYADQTVKQAFHHSMASWLPYFGALVLPRENVDGYAFRSSLASMTLLVHDLRRSEVDWRPLKPLTEEWRRVTADGYFYGDYYPLTPFNRDETQWIAWQFNRPDTGKGMVQAFRRKDSPARTMLFRLSGLDPAAMYVVTDLDQPGKPVKRTGRKLMEAGLPVEMKAAPQAAVIVYRLAGATN
jgi:alpha-galactosidase